MLAFIISTIISAFISGTLFYFFIPAINLASSGFWWCLIVALAIFAGIYAIVYYFSEGDYCERSAPIIGVITGVAVAVFAICGIISAPIFQSGNFRNALTIDVATEGAATFELPRIEEAGDIPTIDRYTASKLGDRVMGTMEEYLSQYEVSNEYSLVEYQGNFFRISPLEYGGYWKYNNSKKVGIPAYVMVDIYTGEATLVKLSTENAIRYAPSAYFGKDMMRHLRRQHKGAIFGDYHFEIDESGTPYYIISTLKPSAGVFGAKVVTGAIVMNAATGESTKYTIENIPHWVDSIFSVEGTMKVINWHYKYVHGAINFSKKDVRRTSYSYDNSQFYLLPKDGDVYMYTGVTSAGNDESNIGFILANMRTGKVTYYASAGAEESSAQSSANGLVANYGYTAGPVMLVSIDSTETYFMTLKDNHGLVKRYALVNKEDYNVASIAETVEEVVYTYRHKVSSVETIGDAGIIESVSEVVIDGNTTYIFRFVDIDAYYLSDISVSFEQPTKLVPGATVRLAYTTFEGNRMVNSITFE